MKMQRELCAWAGNSLSSNVSGWIDLCHVMKGIFLRYNDIVPAAGGYPPLTSTQVFGSERVVIHVFRMDKCTVLSTHCHVVVGLASVGRIGYGPRIQRGSVRRPSKQESKCE